MKLRRKEGVGRIVLLRTSCLMTSAGSNSITSSKVSSHAWATAKQTHEHMHYNYITEQSRLSIGFELAESIAALYYNLLKEKFSDMQFYLDLDCPESSKYSVGMFA